MIYDYYNSSEYILSQIEDLTDSSTNIKTYELFRKLKERLNNYDDIILELEDLKNDIDDSYCNECDYLETENNRLERLIEKQDNQYNLLQKAYDELQQEYKQFAITQGILLE